MFKCQIVHPECTSDAFKTGKAWKIHATRSHGGYKDSEYLKVSRSASMPAAVGDFTAQPPDSEKPPEVQPAVQKPDLFNEKFQATKQKLASGIGKILWSALSRKFNLEPLTSKDEETIAEGFSAALEAISIEPQIAPIQKRLTSPLWVIVLPLTAFAIVFLEKVKLDDLWNFFNPAENESDHRSDSAEGKR